MWKNESAEKKSGGCGCGCGGEKKEEANAIVEMESLELEPVFPRKE